jgi:hypothetical protein
MKKITYVKIGLLLIEILHKLHYVPRFESFMVADLGEWPSGMNVM